MAISPLCNDIFLQTAYTNALNIMSARCLIRKIFHFDSPRARYKADAAIVWCFDHRFDLVLRKLIKRIGAEHVDPILVAGGAKCLAGDDLERDRQFVLEQVRKSMQLHGTHTVLLMLHSDCGAYGGLAAFDNDHCSSKPRTTAMTCIARWIFCRRRFRS